jgi:NDP-sugar pyrophosphorylase family protein
MGSTSRSPRYSTTSRPARSWTSPTSYCGCWTTASGVGSFLYEGYWLDIGRHEDYERAIVEYEQLKHQLFGEFEVEIASSGAAAVAAPDTG